MKPFPTIVMCVAFFVSTVVAGLSVARGQQPRPGGINFQELFASVDSDNDLAITRQEVTESARPAFDRLLKLADKNSNGKLDRVEYRDMLVRARDSAASGAAGRFASLDKNGDGKISRDEMAAQPFLFDRLDADKDGVVTREEAAAFRPGDGGSGQPGQRLRGMDKNGDGKVTREEFTGPPQLFERLDRDKSGAIEPAEFPAAPLTAPAKKDKAKEAAPSIPAP